MRPPNRRRQPGRRRVCQGPRFSKGSRKGWEPRRRNIEARAWAAGQPADRKRPDLDALMTDLDAPERKALQALENAKGFLAERQGKS
jgi:hypothetical protein